MLTAENTRVFLTKCGDDLVNEPQQFASLQQVPKALVRSHAAGILKHYYWLCSDAYGWHEDYSGAWLSVVEAIAAADASAVATLVEKALLPALEKAASAFKAGGDLFQHPLADNAGMLRDIASVEVQLLAPCATRLAAALRPHWGALVDFDPYPTRDAKSFATLREALEHLVKSNA